MAPDVCRQGGVVKQAVSADYVRGGAQKEHYGADEVEKCNCPLCDSVDCSNIYKERGSIGIVRCAGCGLVYVNPRVKEPEKNYWGDVDRYYEEARLIFKGEAPHHRDPNYKADMRMIEKIKPTGNFLDIGTNMGFFLRHTQGRRWNVLGIEPSPALSEIARRYFGLNVKTSYLEGARLEEGSFDVVTMTDVLEHMPEPKKTLLEIKRVLRKDGILFIKVPNGKYNLLKLFMARPTGQAAHYDIFDSYEHVVHYTQETLRRMLESSGFAVVKTAIGRPMQTPAWHKYVGHYYQYPSPWFLDAKNHLLRICFYWISRLEFILRLGRIGYFAPNIIVIVKKVHDSNGE